jgi:hypothetical protein
MLSSLFKNSLKSPVGALYIARTYCSSGRKVTTQKVPFFEFFIEKMQKWYIFMWKSFTSETVIATAR